MNRFFGFFKQKIKEVKQQNKQEIQNIINAFEYQPYSNVQMLTNLQEIKTNYLQWSIMIANQASTGLYFTQLHNKSSVMRKIKSLRQSEERKNKNQISLEQMQKTLVQLKQIEKLNYAWVNNINQKVDRISIVLSEDKKNKRQRQAKQKQIIQQVYNTNQKVDNNQDHNNQINQQLQKVQLVNQIIISKDQQIQQHHNLKQLDKQSICTQISTSNEIQKNKISQSLKQ